MVLFLTFLYSITPEEYGFEMYWISAAAEIEKQYPTHLDNTIITVRFMLYIYFYAAQPYCVA